MDKIKIKDAAIEQGVKPEDLVARLREAGIEKTVKGSISPEEYEKVKVKKSEASVEVVRKDVIIRRRSKPAAAEAPAAPVVEEKAEAPVAAAEAPAAPVAPEEPRPVAEKAQKKPRTPREPAPVARIVRPAQVVTPAPAPAVAEVPAAPAASVAEKPAAKAVEEKPAAEVRSAVEAKPVAEGRTEERVDRTRARKVEVPAARIVTPKPAPAAPAPEVKVVSEAKVVAQPEVKAEAPKADRRRPAPAASAEPEGSSQPSLLPPVQERRHASEEAEGEDARRKPQPAAADSAPRVRVISRPDPTQARIVRPAAPSEGRSGRDGDSRRDGGRRDMRDARGLSLPAYSSIANCLENLNCFWTYFFYFFGNF